MENASKALIIAASILIAILIIALGVTIFNRAQDAASTESLDTAEINMFNQKFEKYSTGEDEDVLGSQVKTLVSTAISNASTNKDDQIKIPDISFTDKVGTLTEAQGHEKVTDPLSGTDGLSDYISSLSNIKNNINSTHSYTVKCEYGDAGLIKKITIKYKP